MPSLDPAECRRRFGADATARVVAEGREHARAVAAVRARYDPYRDAPPAGPAVLARVVRWTGWTAVHGAASRPERYM